MFNIEFVPSSTVHVCLHVSGECHQSMGPVSVCILKAGGGWFLCVLHPLCLHPSALYLLRSSNPAVNQTRESKKGLMRNWGLWRLKLRTREIKDFNKHVLMQLIHIPPDHNIHFLASWCIQAGLSVSATRRWSDYSCLKTKSRRDTDYIPAHMHKHSHACTCFLLWAGFWEKIKWKSSLTPAYLQKAANKTHKQRGFGLFDLQQWQHVTPTCLRGLPKDFTFLALFLAIFLSHNVSLFSGIPFVFLTSLHLLTFK